MRKGHRWQGGRRSQRGERGRGWRRAGEAGPRGRWGRAWGDSGRAGRWGGGAGPWAWALWGGMGGRDGVGNPTGGARAGGALHAPLSHPTERGREGGLDQGIGGYQGSGFGLPILRSPHSRPANRTPHRATWSNCGPPTTPVPYPTFRWRTYRFPERSPSQKFCGKK